MKLFALAAVIIAMASCGSAATETRVLRETSAQQAMILADSATRTITKKEKEGKDIPKKSEEENQELARQRNAVRSSITVEGLKFKRVLLGGFKNIRFNLYNRYNHHVDQVMLTVHYIRANGTEAHSASQTVRNIGAHVKMPVKAPDYTSAGMSLKVTIETVVSKEIDLCYDSNREKFSADPYRCKN